MTTEPDGTGVPGDGCDSCGTDLDDKPAWESSAGLLCRLCAMATGVAGEDIPQ